jgi:hypothetical protein
MEKLNLSGYDEYTLHKIVTEQHLGFEIFKNDKGRQKINLAPFFKNPQKYIDLIEKKSLLSKTLVKLQKLHQLFLLETNTKTTEEEFINAMKIEGTNRNKKFSVAFNFYRKAVFQLTNTHNPLRGRLEGLRLYGLAEPTFKSIDLLSKNKFGGKINKAELFDKKNKTGRDIHIRSLLKKYPNDLYKTLWGKADKSKIGNIKLATFCNYCSKAKESMDKSQIDS